MTKNVSNLSRDHNGHRVMRQSNIELLRIVAMLMIVAHHFAVHGEFEFSTEIITINRLWVQFIQLGGKVGVNIFVLISGYFLVSATSLKISKVLKLMLQIFTYSVICFGVFVAFDIIPFKITDLIRSFLPITYSLWWFASAYFVLYLISPYLNKLLNSLDKKTYQKLLVLLTLCWSVIPTFLMEFWQSNDLLWFIYLYSLSGYIKLHLSGKTFKTAKCIAVSSALIILTFLSAVVLDILAMHISKFSSYVTYFYNMQRLPVLLISLTLFVGFLCLKIKYNPVINIISSATFGVYLIHDNKYVRPFIWGTVFKNASYSDSEMLIPYSITAIFIVFAVCTVIELLRQYAVEKHYLKMVDKISVRLQKIIDKFYCSKIFDKI